MWCPAYDIRKKNDKCHEIRSGIKRSQEDLHSKMLRNSSKKFKEAHVGDSILIPISRPDVISSIGPRNLTRCITSKDNEFYTVGTTEGYLQPST